MGKSNGIETQMDDLTKSNLRTAKSDLRTANRSAYRPTSRKYI
jgi:hypothetical protein